MRLYHGDCLEVMKTLEAGSVDAVVRGNTMNEISDIQAGKAGEYLVCADLLLKGYTAFVVEQALAYDVVVDLNGRIFRVQVKTTRAPRATGDRDLTPAYFFNVRRMGKGGRKAYTKDDADIFALVALDRRHIGYIAEADVRKTMVFRIQDFEGMYFDEQGTERRQRITQMRQEGMSFGAIGKVLEMDRSQVARIVKGEGFRQSGIYLDEFSFEEALKRHGIS